MYYHNTVDKACADSSDCRMQWMPFPKQLPEKMRLMPAKAALFHTGRKILLVISTGCPIKWGLCYVGKVLFLVVRSMNYCDGMQCLSANYPACRLTPHATINNSGNPFEVSGSLVYWADDFGGGDNQSPHVWQTPGTFASRL